MTRLADIFRPEPLPRLRALTTITFAGAALLAAAGTLEFASGSPAAQGTAVTGYWALFFAVHLVAFGGATLIGAFPALARPGVKLVWVAAVAAVYSMAFAVWRRHQAPEGAVLAAWMARNSAYVPAAVAVAVGLFWSNRAAIEEGAE